MKMLLLSPKYKTASEIYPKLVKIRAACLVKYHAALHHHMGIPKMLSLCSDYPGSNRLLKDSYVTA